MKKRIMALLVLLAIPTIAVSTISAHAECTFTGTLAICTSGPAPVGYCGAFLVYVACGGGGERGISER